MRIALEGCGQTQFAGGPVIVGQRRYDWNAEEEEWVVRPAPDYLNVYESYQSNWENYDAANLTPQGLKFDTEDGNATVMVDRLGTGDSALCLKAGGSQVVINSDGHVGVGTDTPNTDARLDVNGAVYYRNASAPSPAPGGAFIYSLASELHAKDGIGNDTVFSPHTDPRSVDPLAQTSFGDATVALPFSFDHKNHVVGKGEIVDMAKMAAYVEKKMQAELGEEAGRLKYTYDLPENEKTTMEKCDADRVKSQAEAVMQKVETMPWIKVELTADGGFPREAIEEVPETVPRNQLVTVREQVVDFESAKIVTVERRETHEVPVPTGRMKKQFKKDWKFENGALYRRPTVDDVNVEDFAKPFSWPQWIVDRVPGGARQISRSASQLIDQIKATLAELGKKGAAQVAEGSRR